MSFIALDVETANAAVSSICSIGVAEFGDDGSILKEWYSLIDPDDYFDPMNISIHGISEADVKGAPTYGAIAEHFHNMLAGGVVVTHSHFDRSAIKRACDNWGVEEPGVTWLDSVRVARRAWVRSDGKGHGLKDMCGLIGYEFQHHHALEDAKAAGHIMLAAMEKTGLDVEGWLARVGQPVNPANSVTTKRDGNPNGPLHGEAIVFTGALMMPRREAADMAALVGCQVQSNVTQQTTILVIGHNDVRRLAGSEKSRKQRRAEELIEQGQQIRIVSEPDFLDLVSEFGDA